MYVRTYIHICWFNFDALAQGNAYKPTKEPINYRGPGGDRTHDLQTEATPPAASCPARTLHATEIAPKNATPMTCPWLHWTTDNLSGMHMVSISTPVCVNFELRPGSDIHICWFNFDALACWQNLLYIHLYIHTYIHTYIHVGKTCSAPECHIKVQHDTQVQKADFDEMTVCSITSNCREEILMEWNDV